MYKCDCNWCCAALLSHPPGFASATISIYMYIVYILLEFSPVLLHIEFHLFCIHIHQQHSTVSAIQTEHTTHNSWKLTVMVWDWSDVINDYRADKSEYIDIRHRQTDAMRCDAQVKYILRQWQMSECNSTEMLAE